MTMSDEEKPPDHRDVCEAVGLDVIGGCRRSALGACKLMLQTKGQYRD